MFISTQTHTITGKIKPQKNSHNYRINKTLKRLTQLQEK